MRIVHVITGLEVGGAEAMLVKLLSRFAAAGAGPESVVVTVTAGGSLAAPIRACGVPVVSLGMGSVLGLPGALVKLQNLSRTLEIDAVQGWMYHGNLAATLLADWSPRRPDLYWNIRHSLADPAREKRLTRQVIRQGARWSGRPRAVIHNATVSIAQHAAVGFRRDNAVMIPNGFDLDRFAPDADARADLRRQWGVPPDGFVIGHLGRFHPMKGHLEFVRVLGDVLRVRPGVHVVMAGRGVEPEQAALAAAVQAAGLGGRIHLLGQTATPERFLAALDLFCLPSLYGEGFPNVLGEAMACGVPCVTTDVGEAAAIVGGTGLVVRPGDAPALADALDRALTGLEGQDPAARETAGRACRASIADRYSLAAVAARYADLYAEPHAEPRTEPRTGKDKR